MSTTDHRDGTGALNTTGLRAVLLRAPDGMQVIVHAECCGSVFGVARAMEDGTCDGVDVLRLFVTNDEDELRDEMALDGVS